MPHGTMLVLRPPFIFCLSRTPSGTKDPQLFSFVLPPLPPIFPSVSATAPQFSADLSMSGLAPFVSDQQRTSPPFHSGA